MTEDWPLRRLLSAVIGAGPKSAEDLSPEQAASAMVQLLDGDHDPTTVGAYLLANRWKGNTPEELAAYLDVLRDRVTVEPPPDVDAVDCGANYDGKERTALLGVASGLTAAAAGTPVVVHSGDRIPMQEASSYKHVLDELGVETDLSPGESADMVEEAGFGFYYQPRICPALDALLDRRRAMGVRTVFNTIETLVNPAGTRIHLGSFYHLTFAKKLASTIEASTVGFDRAVLVQGLEGYDDVRPGQTTIAEWDSAGELTPDEIRTADLGLSVSEADLAVNDVAADSARLTEAVLTGERSGPIAEAVALNAALRLYAGSAVDSIHEGIDRARHAIADGRAADRLEALTSRR